MLSEKEREGIAAILRRVPQHDLKSLAETITNRLVQITTQEEAISAIVTYAGSALDILKRRKMKKEFIFQYLHECRHVILPTLDKKDIVLATLNYWQSTGCDQELMLMEADDEVDIERGSEQEPAACGPTSVNNNNNNNNNDSFQVQLATMAHKFITWFYPLLNNGHVANPNAADNFGAHHFWRDCRFKMTSPQCEQLCEGDETVARALLALIGDNQLYFQPFDVHDGLRFQCDPHGLVSILVGGSIHRADLSIGIFEQKFGLIKDPTTDNWKIKFVELQLAGKDLDLFAPEVALDCYHHHYEQLAAIDGPSMTS